MKKHKTTKGSTGKHRLPSVRSFRHDNPAARLVSALAAFAIATLLVVGVGVAIAPAQAASPCPIPGGFEIDGDMNEQTCDPGADDWDTSGLGVQMTEQGGTYSTAGKDDADPSTWVSSGSTPDKTNFERAYATSRTVDIGGGVLHYFVYVAWERTNTTGTQGYAIEIDDSGANVADDGTPQPDRSNGGTVFYISSQGASAPAFDGACEFASQSDYGDTCTNSGASVTSAINTAAITDPFTDLSQPAGSFFEVALDITELTGEAPSCPGPDAATVYLRSITGQTSNGNLKGYMAPLEVKPDSTCVAPDITTTATPGGGQVAPGTTQHDEVTVGTDAEPGVGDVDFFLCSPAEVTANGGDCSADGTLVSTESLVDGEASSDAVDGTTDPDDLATGKYCWRAEFTPSADDENYLPGSHTNSTTECFTVVRAGPSIATDIVVTGEGAPGVGLTTLGDTAVLTGFVPGTVTGDEVAFDLYGPYGTGVTPTCTGDPIFSTKGALDATGHATTDETFSPTQAGTYVWIASYAGDTFNDPIAGVCSDADESATILPPSVTLTKTADAASVNAGGQIGFTVTASNSNVAGTGVATGVALNDPLPAGPGVDWTIASGSSNCSITGTPPTEALQCTAVDLAPGESVSVHLVSATSSTTSCQAYPNTASLTATNHASLNASATTTVVNCVVVLPPQPEQPHPHVLPNTGGPDGGLIAAGLALLLAGGTLVLADQRRKRRS